jgi:phenylacetic acid degradation operon negative regulatory protein
MGKIPASHRRLPRAVLAPVLEKLRSEPSRTWSIIITIYGDAILPRGGCVWVGTLIAFFEALEIANSVVRTAMSRLAADGWLERSKVGRNSFYRLAEKGRATFAEASRHIYTERRPPFTGHLHLIFPANATERDALRPALQGAGFGSPSAGLWLSPGRDIPEIAAKALSLEVGGRAEALQALAARSWPLEEIGQAYCQFIKAFEPLRRALDREADIGELEAFVARILLIHEYRRVVLRDPILPAPALPSGWPGNPARNLCAELYKQLLGPSERWLDRHAVDETGAALPAGTSLSSRFQIKK